MTDPLAWEDPRRALARHGLAPKRGFSQNFLVAPGVVDGIADALRLAPGDRVIELGPGLGTLTKALLARGASVVAVERDREMAAVLRDDLGSVPTLRVVEDDAATVDLRALAAEMGGPAAVAGNLPYAITGAILRQLTRHRAALTRAVVMVQREVRDRWLAPPGDRRYGAPTVFLSAAFDIAPVMLVRAGCFHPRPKVDSAVVALTPLATPRAEETPAFRTVVRAAFNARRKTLRNALLRADPEAARVDAALATAGVDGSRRGETLSVEELRAVAEAWRGPTLPDE